MYRWNLSAKALLSLARWPHFSIHVTFFSLGFSASYTYREMVFWCLISIIIIFPLNDAERGCFHRNESIFPVADWKLRHRTIRYERYRLNIASKRDPRKQERYIRVVLTRLPGYSRYCCVFRRLARARSKSSVITILFRDHLERIVPAFIRDTNQFDVFEESLVFDGFNFRYLISILHMECI